ncbi:PAS domain S-box protein [Scytonema sp. UIC 10036]|uniref:PAS domain S-box protein n=1 Tax=Scytonema sp. UIC 10036 TaxID=2304196 RepID=UPI0012DA122B|nr:PAS domain S-box protein [Scytonema sp. UIC 10036]MUG98175.1 PAS domain S-box protein [Scytonema sp. UIC 10036]
MFDLITPLFNSGSFIPHGHCFLWQPTLIWLHVVSDSVIALAYYSIPITLFHFIQKRKDLPFDWVFALFAVFITACGTSHLMSVWTLWHPIYWLSGGIKAITALVSLSTAIALFPLMPKALAIPSRVELEAANWALQQEIAERKRMETELLHNRELREAIFHESADSLFLVNPETLLTLDCNRQAVKMFQAVDKTDLIGIEGQSLQRHQFSADELDAIVAEMQSKGVWRRDIEYVTRQGNFFWGSIAAKPITVAGRTINLVRVKDITERKQIEAEHEQAEQALKLSEARYRAIVEDQTELIVRFLPDSTILFANEAYCRYFGLQANETIGKSYAPLIFEQDQETVAQLVQSIGVDNPTVVIENRVVIGEGIRWTQWVNRAFFDRQGDLHEVQAVGRDITALKQVEAALRESNRRFATLAEAAPVAIFRYDADGNCSYVNDRWCEMTGRPLEMGMGTEWLQTLHPEDRDRTINAWSRWVESHQPGEFFQNEARIVRPDGTILWYYCQVTPETNSNGELIGYIGTLTDIHDRKQAEAQLQASLREKEVLLKEIHHRVKNNLQIVYSLLRLQRRKLKDQLAANALLESQSRIEAIALIHEKLYQSEDLSRINLAEYIPSLITNLVSTFNVDRIQIDLRIEIEPALVNIDKAIRCGLIINELLSNSLKYAFSASTLCNPCIYVKFTKVEKSTFSLIVGDNGVGIPHHVDLLHLETLGLQLVQGFVQQLKGTLQANCQSGTEFHILFPGEEV